jgi:superfamily II DNA or RNA helicase
MELRDFQHKAIDEVDRHHRPLLVASTGSGKTVMAAEIMRRAENQHILFLAHRRELIFQARELGDFGVDSGVILAGEAMNLIARVQVASIQTLWSRRVKGGAVHAFPPADVVFIDEAHHCRATTYRKLINSYPDARIIGMTATPCRRDGRGLGSTFSALVECPQVEELILLGFLVKTRVFAPSTPISLVSTPGTVTTSRVSLPSVSTGPSVGPLLGMVRRELGECGAQDDGRGSCSRHYHPIDWRDLRLHCR